MIGETVSHYRILSKLGGGGMGVVYEAEDLNLGRKVALKFLPDARESPEALERFKREARAASALNHPHICVVYDLGEYQGKPFIAMERMKGETLKQTLATGPMPLGRVVELGSQVADALEAAHGAGIVHRDLKPANVFVTERGETKLPDFGLAKLAGTERQVFGSEVETAERERNLTSPGTTLGTVAYMSPEAGGGDGGGRAERPLLAGSAGLRDGDGSSALRLWPLPDLSKPPLHTLPHNELLAKLHSLTNLRVIRDPSSPNGWKVEVDPFPGWKNVPAW